MGNARPTAIQRWHGEHEPERGLVRGRDGVWLCSNAVGSQSKERRRMIIATNLENLNDLPRPSARTGWQRTVYLSNDMACDGSILVIGKLKASDRANIERHGNLDAEKYGRDRSEVEIAGVIAHETRNLTDLEAVEFLGCASGLAFLKHRRPSAKLPA